MVVACTVAGGGDDSERVVRFGKLMTRIPTLTTTMTCLSKALAKGRWG